MSFYSPSLRSGGGVGERRENQRMRDVPAGLVERRSVRVDVMWELASEYSKFGSAPLHCKAGDDDVT